jgi:hypothetical protein
MRFELRAPAGARDGRAREASGGPSSSAHMRFEREAAKPPETSEDAKRHFN